MLLHLQPRLYSPCRNVAIVDLAIEPFGLRLAGGVELATGRPYPNKHYAIAYRKNKTRKAFNGILIEIPGPVDEWHMTARWSVEAEIVVTHHVDYRLLDHDFDTASEDQTLWYAACAELGGWSNRWPSPDLRQSRVMMEVVPREYHEREKPVTYRDTLDHERGLIVQRCQAFDMPTIERGRLTKPLISDAERMPPFESAFRVVPVNVGENAENSPSRPISSRTQESVAPGCVKIR